MLIRYPNASWWLIGVIFLTVLLKEGLAFYSRFLGKRINSDVLLADAWHHRLDAISSFLVVLAFVFSHFNWYFLDGPAGILISLIIVYSAYKIVKRPIDYLLGTPPQEELLGRIEELTLNFPEVHGVHDVIIHNYGEKMIISLHIEMDDHLSFLEAHRIAENVDKKLRDEINAHVTVHFDPVMERTPVYNKIESKIKEFCQKTPECDSFHDLRLYGSQKHLRVILDLVASPSSPESATEKLIENCQNFLKSEFPDVEKVSVKVEPKFSVSRKSRHDPV